MLQICFEIYLVLSLPAALLLWMSLAVSRMDEVEGGQDRQRFYRIAWEISNPQNTRSGKEYDLSEDPTI